MRSDPKNAASIGMIDHKADAMKSSEKGLRSPNPIAGWVLGPDR